MASQKDYGRLMHQGLWQNNVAMVQLLGLCPTLAVTSNLINGLGMGIATIFVVLGSNILISLLRNVIHPDVRIPAYVLVIASLVTVTDLAMNAYLPELHKVLGIFIPLIVVNCLVIGRAEAFASKNGPAAAAVDGLAMGLGFTFALMALGGLRELLGNGTLFSQAHLMFGASAQGLTLSLGADFQGMLLAILPPGAFIGLGFLIALKNLIDQRAARRSTVQPLDTVQAAVG
jgi:Na+-translocating ferredoxin:NAD+ oxidoreductase subunit E